MNPLISLAFLTFIVMVGFAVILSVGQPVIEKVTDSEKVRVVENIMRLIDNSISYVAEEGIGSSRLIKFYSPGAIQSIPEENAIQFRAESAIIEYFSRRVVGSLVYISGNDVSCRTGSDLTMENSYISIVFQKIENSTINTEDNILMIREKSSGIAIYPTNSSVVIDDDPRTAHGTGYSEILRAGDKLPSCQVHFFVNSTVSYDIYYTLYSGADFIEVEVRNVA